MRYYIKRIDNNLYGVFCDYGNHTRKIFEGTETDCREYLGELS